MTSYIPLTLKGNAYPVKVGGKTKGEPTGPAERMSKDTERRLIRAFVEHDKKTLEELEEETTRTAIMDIKTAYTAWIPKEISHLVPFSTKELIFAITPDKTITVAVKPIKKYGKPPEKPTKGPTAKLAPFQVVRKPAESDKSYAQRVEMDVTEDRMPFFNLTKAELWTMLENGLILLDKFTLSRKLKKGQVLSAKKNPNKLMPSHIPCTAFVEVKFPDKESEMYMFKDSIKMHQFIEELYNEGGEAIIHYPYDDGFQAGYKSGWKDVRSFASGQEPKLKKEGMEKLSALLNPMTSGYANKDLDKDYLLGFENGYKQAWLEQVNQAPVIDVRTGKEVSLKFPVIEMPTSLIKSSYAEHEDKKCDVCHEYGNMKWYKLTYANNETEILWACDICLARSKELIESGRIIKIERIKPIMDKSRPSTVLGRSGQINIPDPEKAARLPGGKKKLKTRVLDDGTIQVRIPQMTYTVKELHEYRDPPQRVLEVKTWYDKHGKKYERKEKIVYDPKGFVYDREAQTIKRKAYWMTIGKMSKED